MHERAVPEQGVSASRVKILANEPRRGCIALQVVRKPIDRRRVLAVDRQRTSAPIATNVR